MRRRDLLALAAGAAASRSFTAAAQQGERVRRIGVLLNLAPDDPEIRARLDAFLEGLRQLGWSERAERSTTTSTSSS